MQNEMPDPAETPREPMQDLPAGQSPLLKAAEDKRDAAEAEMFVAEAAVKADPAAVAGALSGQGGQAPLQPPAQGALPPEVPRDAKELVDMTGAELARHSERQETLAWAIMYERFNTLFKAAQQAMNVILMAEIMKAMAEVMAKRTEVEAKREDMERARKWDKRLGDIIVTKADPSLLGQGPMGLSTAKIAGNLQKARKLAAGDGRTTPEKGKRAGGPRPLPPDDV